MSQKSLSSPFCIMVGKGRSWAAPVACNVMAAYFGIGQYAQFSGDANAEFNESDIRACNSLSFNPVMPLDLLDSVQRQ